MNSDFVLFPTGSTWRIARFRRGRCEWFTAESDVAAGLRELGFAGRPVVLAIPSDGCLCARIDTAGLPRNDRKAMAYRLEEMLPVAAESVVADFTDFPGGSLGVCVQLDRVAPVVTALEQAGVAVQAVVPAGLAAAQAASVAETNAIFLLGDTDPGMVSVVGLRDGRLFDWAVLPATVADVKLHLRFLSQEVSAEPKLIAVGVAPALTEAVGATISRPDVSVADLAAALCVDLLHGRKKPWVDFRRDALAAGDRLRLYRRPLNLLLGAAATFLLSTTLCLLVRSQHYRNQELDSRAKMVAEFRTHFPGWVLPMNVKAVVESQHRQARGAAGVTTAGDSFGTAFTTLRDVLVGLPPGGGYAIERMSFADASFELSGRLESYEQVDALATAARKTGMDVPPPQTRKEASGSWTFTLQGNRPGKTR